MTQPADALAAGVLVTSVFPHARLAGARFDAAGWVAALLTAGFAVEAAVIFVAAFADGVLADGALALSF